MTKSDPIKAARKKLGNKKLLRLALSVGFGCLNDLEKDQMEALGLELGEGELPDSLYLAEGDHLWRGSRLSKETGHTLPITFPNKFVKLLAVEVVLSLTMNKE